MKYLGSTFHVPLGGKAYSENWERTFRPRLEPVGWGDCGGCSGYRELFANPSGEAVARCKECIDAKRTGPVQR